MNILGNKTYFRFLSFMLSASIFLNIVFANLLPIIRSHHVWVLLWFMSLLFFKPQILKNKYLLFFLLYGAVMLLLLLNTLWIDIDEWNKRQITREFYDMAVAISVIIYYRIEKDYTGLAKLVKWTFVFIVITAIMSIVTSILNPMYTRELIGLSSVDGASAREQILSYRKYGGGGYGFAAALVLLFPMLIYYYKNNKKSYWSKKYLMLSLIIIFLALIRMQIFANILISFAIIVLSLLGRKKVVKSLVCIGALAVILLLIPMQYYVDLLTYIGGWFDTSSDLYFKFNQLAQYLSIGGGFEETAFGRRAARYPLLLKSFISNPLYGGKYSSGHLYWMNKLAVYGLLGMIPFLFIIYKNIKNNLRYFDKEFAFYFFLSMFSIIALGSMKALAGTELWYVFFIIIPGFYYTQLIRKKKFRFLKKKDWKCNNFGK